MTEPQDLNETVLEALKTRNGPKLVNELIGLFLEYVPQRVADAVAGKKAGEIEVVRRAVHSIKSSAGNIGAEVLLDLASRIEQLASDGDEISVEPLISQLENAYSRLLPRLEIYRKGIAK